MCASKAAMLVVEGQTGEHDQNHGQEEHVNALQEVILNRQVEHRRVVAKRPRL